MVLSATELPAVRDALKPIARCASNRACNPAKGVKNGLRIECVKILTVLGVKPRQGCGFDPRGLDLQLKICNRQVPQSDGSRGLVPRSG